MTLIGNWLRTGGVRLDYTPESKTLAEKFFRKITDFEYAMEFERYKKKLGENNNTDGTSVGYD